MRRLSNYLCGAEQKPSEALGNTHTCVLPLPRRPYRRCGLFVCGSSPYRHSERSVGIQRSESKSSACVRSTLHQAIGRAKLRQDFLPVLDLRAYARLCGEIARASKVLSNKRTLVAFTYAPLEQLLVRSRAINLARLSAIRTLAY